MHELTVTQHILDLALQHGKAHDATHISEINLVVGQLTSIVDDCVQFYWDIISEGTMARGAHLNFQRVPARMSCLNCHQSYKLDDSELICPFCKSHDVKITDGDQFFVESIEIETD